MPHICIQWIPLLYNNSIINPDFLIWTNKFAYQEALIQTFHTSFFTTNTLRVFTIQLVIFFLNLKFFWIIIKYRQIIKSIEWWKANKTSIFIILQRNLKKYLNKLVLITMTNFTCWMNDVVFWMTNYIH